MANKKQKRVAVPQRVRLKQSQISVMLPIPLVEEIKARAVDTDVSFSQCIRSLLKFAVERQGEE